jgi:hypothetical protein
LGAQDKTWWPHPRPRGLNGNLSDACAEPGAGQGTKLAPT